MNIKLAYYNKDIYEKTCYDGILLVKKGGILYKKIQVYQGEIYDINLIPEKYDQFNNYEYCIKNHRYINYRRVTFRQAYHYLVRQCNISITLFYSIFGNQDNDIQNENHVFQYKGINVIIEKDVKLSNQDQIKKIIDQIKRIFPSYIYERIVNGVWIQIIKGCEYGFSDNRYNLIRLGQGLGTYNDKLQSLIHEFGHRYSKYIKKDKVDRVIDYIKNNEDEIKLRKGDIITFDYGINNEKMKGMTVDLEVLDVRGHKFKIIPVNNDQNYEAEWYSDLYYYFITKINGKEIRRSSISQYSKYDRDEFIAQYFAGYFLNNIKDMNIRQMVGEWFE